MTADPKARRLSTEFFGQWLGFYHFDEYRGVDTGRFPEFTDDVRRAMRRGGRDVRIPDPRAAPGEGNPARRLHLPEQAAGEVLRRRREAGADRHRPEGRGRVEVRPRRRAAPRLGADHDVGAAAQPGEARRLDPAPHPVDATPPPPPDAGTLPADDKSFEGQTLRALTRTSATPSAPPATCASIRSASRSRASTRSAGRAPPTTTASRSTPPASSATSRRSSAPTACSATCRSRTRKC